MKKKYQYFWMAGTEPCRGGGMAMAPKDFDTIELMQAGINRHAMRYLKELNEIPCIFEVTKGLLLDYLECNMAYPLFSNRLKEVIEANTIVKPYRWVRANIKYIPTNEMFVYYMPLFEHLVDTISYENSRYTESFSGGHSSMYQACYSLKKIKQLNVDFFPEHDVTVGKEINEEIPYFIDFVLIVSYQLKQAIKKAGLVGMIFIHVPFVDDVDHDSNERIFKTSRDD